MIVYKEHTSMKLSITNMKKARVDDSILVQGKVAPCADGFAINLGHDNSNLLIQCNPHFGERVIVYNSKKDGNWGEEMRDHHFPFAQGEDTKLTFTLNHNEVTVTYPDGQVFDFKSQIIPDFVKYISVEGDFEVQSIDIQ
ncbi:galectin-2-like [Eublepharis macularius]|uniref:Galectin n=1 Tax=Eublepharis macularius TaxID=481883 RepID=A0AA97J3N8_EUBMA|nr:galectin-2-like [Eublepharis macularius]